jgi:hypothetical protein
VATEHNKQHAELGAILAQLRAEVRAQRLARGVAEQGSYERDLRRALDELELHRVVSAHWPLVARTPLQRAINLVHKLVRRSLRWYINPIVEQQNAYNDALARALRLLGDGYLDLAEQVASATAANNRTASSSSNIAPFEQRGAGSNDQVSARNDQVSARNDQVSARNDQVSARNDQVSARNDQMPGSEHVSTARIVKVFDARIRQAAVHEPAARFPDLEVRANVAALRTSPPVSAHWPLGGTTLFERLLALHHRVVRQYLRWYINPIVDQQNACNDALVAALHAIVRLDGQRRAQVAELRATEAQRAKRAQDE